MDAATSPEDEVDARLALVELYLRAGRAQDAVACAQIAASCRPDGQTYAALCSAFLAAGDIAKAETAALTAVEKDTLSAEAHLALARVLRAQARPDEALKETNRALELNPYLVEGLELAGALREAAGDFEKCAGFLQKALELNPWNAQLHHRLSEILGPKLGDRAGADQHLKEYAELERMRTEAAQ